MRPAVLHWRTSCFRQRCPTNHYHVQLMTYCPLPEERGLSSLRRGRESDRSRFSCAVDGAQCRYRSRSCAVPSSGSILAALKVDPSVLLNSCFVIPLTHLGCVSVCARVCACVRVRVAQKDWYCERLLKQVKMNILMHFTGRCVSVSVWVCVSVCILAEGQDSGKRWGGNCFIFTAVSVLPQLSCVRACVTHMCVSTG